VDHTRQPRLRAIGGPPAHAPAASPAAPTTYDAPPSAPDSDEAPPRYFTKTTVCRHIAISVRTWDRATAMGLTPEPDLMVSRSPRWSPETIARWLRTKPRLPGRGK